MRREVARGARFWAAADLGGNALPGVAAMAAIRASLALGLSGVGASGEWFAAIAFVSGLGAPFVQFVATRGLSKQAVQTGDRGTESEADSPLRVDPAGGHPARGSGLSGGISVG